MTASATQNMPTTRKSVVLFGIKKNRNKEEDEYTYDIYGKVKKPKKRRRPMRRVKKVFKSIKKRTLDRLFREIDTNGDGVLSKQEISEYTYQHGTFLSKEDAQELLYLLRQVKDYNGDGVISPDEFDRSLSRFVLQNQKEREELHQLEQEYPYQPQTYRPKPNLYQTPPVHRPLGSFDESSINPNHNLNNNDGAIDPNHNNHINGTMDQNRNHNNNGVIDPNDVNGVEVGSQTHQITSKPMDVDSESSVERVMLASNRTKFDLFDADGDGTISEDEFDRAAALSALGEKDDSSDKVARYLGELEPLERQEMRLDGFDPYILVSVLTAESSFDVINDYQSEWNEILSKTSLASLTPEDWIVSLLLLTAGTSTFIGIYAAVIFSLTVLYGRTALGMSRDDEYFVFLDNTGLQRFRGFQAFSLSLALFCVLVVLELFEKSPTFLWPPIALASAFFLYVGKSEYTFITEAAAPMFAPRTDNDDYDNDEDEDEGDDAGQDDDNEGKDQDGRR
ncbi:unnamed protein product [Pseudo-nitzschia multistriata]|uniref:EF-hand domain-containing protein n=1 Tax=Pseudo-nitzschia multistriata TaxID=183589 RepID=A0A448ZDL5_9STRA|nr:unnamed protein product [Pseudo-nitzschia multistriata]